MYDQEYMNIVLEEDPDYSYKRENFKICEVEAENMKKILTIWIAVHIACIFITFYREVFEAYGGLIGAYMRGCEVIAIVVYLSTIA